MHLEILAWEVVSQDLLKLPGEPDGTGEEVFHNSSPEMPNLSELGFKQRRRRLVSLSLYLADLLSIVLAFCFASIARLGYLDVEQVGSVLITIIPIYCGAALQNNAHSAAVTFDLFRSVRRAGSAFALAATTLLLVAFFMQIGAQFSRMLFGLGVLMALALILVSRYALARFARVYLGARPYALLYIFDGEGRFDTTDGVAIEARRHGLIPNPQDPEMVSRLGHVAKGMDKVIVHCLPENRLNWAFLMRSLDVPSEVVIPELDELAPLAIFRRSERTTLQLTNGMLGWNERILKRLFDLVFFVLALPLILPIGFLLGLLIKLDSPGPVFFKQPRIGLGNRPFLIYKFRSMYVDSGDARGDRSASRTDDRVTRVGRILRKSSLDELPQFINVLRGDMSVVGPRPHAEGSRAEDLLFWDIDKRYWHRHSVKPGMTGLAQVRGYRGATELKSDLSDRLHSDLEYVAQWSLLNDLKIVFQTFAVLVHRNAF